MVKNITIKIQLVVFDLSLNNILLETNSNFLLEFSINNFLTAEIQNLDIMQLVINNFSFLKESLSEINLLSSFQIDNQQETTLKVIAYTQINSELSNIDNKFKFVKFTESTFLPLELQNQILIAKSKLQSLNNLFKIKVVGIVFNQNQEVLLTKKVNSNMFELPNAFLKSNQTNLQSSWEALEDKIAKVIFKVTGIEIADGPIPLIDKISIVKSESNYISQYFLCQYRFGKVQLQNPNLYQEIKWLNINNISQNEIFEDDNLVIQKAIKFINRVSN